MAAGIHLTVQPFTTTASAVSYAGGMDAKALSDRDGRRASIQLDGNDRTGSLVARCVR